MKHVHLLDDPPEVWIGRVGLDLSPIGWGAVARRRGGRLAVIIDPHPKTWRQRKRGYFPRRGRWPIYYSWQLGPVTMYRFGPGPS